MNHHIDTRWSRTFHTVKARSSKEAQTRMRKRLAGMQLHSVSLVAVLEDVDPNETKN